MKKIVITLTLLSLTGCSTVQSVFMAGYDNNEYGLVNKVRTIAQIRSCDAQSIRDLYSTTLELKNFSQYIPRNQKTSEMDEGLYKMVEELYKKPQPISSVYCDLKLKTIETTAETIQSVTGKKPR